MARYFRQQSHCGHGNHIHICSYLLPFLIFHHPSLSLSDQHHHHSHDRHETPTISHRSHSPRLHSLLQSLDRNNVKRRRTRRAAFITDEIQANMVADDRGQAFLVNFSIGRPPVPQLVGIDTGSDLLWVQCRPCADCFRQSTPIFDPSKSSTFVDLSYDSPICPNSPQKKCNHLNQCIYNASYADGSTTSGNLATEDIVFETSDQGTVTVSSVVFGCGHSNRGRFDGQQSGILGLSAGDQSIVSRLGSRFSYCIGDLFDPHYTHNQLVLGDGVKMEGSSTPFHTFNGFYYVTLEGISVGETRLDINPEVFQRTESAKEEWSWTLERPQHC